MLWCDSKVHGINHNVGKVFKCECDICEKEIVNNSWHYDICIEAYDTEPIGYYDACCDECLHKLLEKKKEYYKTEYEYDEYFECIPCNKVEITWDKLDIDSYNKYHKEED